MQAGSGRVGTLQGLSVAIALGIGAVHALDAYALRTGERAAALEVVLTLLSLACGIGLLVLGVLVARRRSMRWWRLLAVPAIVVGVFWSLLPAGLAWVATNPGTGGGPGDTPASVGLAFDDVELATADGVSLAAWYVPSRSGAAVLLLHGAGGSNRASVLPHAKVLAERGYGVLMLDTRGHGASGGRGMDWGWFGDADIAPALDYLEGREDIDPSRIAVVGLSMGGEQAITAAAGDRRVAAVVAEGATTRVYEDVRGSLTGPAVFFGVPQYRALYGLSDLLSRATPPMPLDDAVRQLAPRPLLLLCTDAEAAYGRRFQAISPASTKLWAPSSARHTGALSENAEEWEREVVGFLDGAMGGMLPD